MTAMRILIVHAHPEPRSFNGALTDSARALLPTIGHELIVWERGQAAQLSLQQRMQGVGHRRRRGLRFP